MLKATVTAIKEDAHQQLEALQAREDILTVLVEIYHLESSKARRMVQGGSFESALGVDNIQELLAEMERGNFTKMDNYFDDCCLTNTRDPSQTVASVLSSQTKRDEDMGVSEPAKVIYLKFTKKRVFGL